MIRFQAYIYLLPDRQQVFFSEQDPLITYEYATPTSPEVEIYILRGWEQLL